jgi:hypothetical protein
MKEIEKELTITIEEGFAIIHSTRHVLTQVVMDTKACIANVFNNKGIVKEGDGR